MTDQDPQSDQQPRQAAFDASGVATDATAVIGTGCIVYGVWMIFHPAAFIIGGAFLLTGAWLAARRADR